MSRLVQSVCLSCIVVLNILIIIIIVIILCVTLSAETWVRTATVVLQTLSFSMGLSFGLRILKVLLKM